MCSGRRLSLESDDGVMALHGTDESALLDSPPEIRDRRLLPV
jgi:hypothetical protein